MSRMGLGVLGLMVAVWVGGPTAAWAGMPSFTLSEPASTRLEVISFFGIAFLACSAVVRWLWNSLRNDFPRLPVLSFPRAAGLTLVWGMLFLLVLTMISGARELLTPGAWRKEGATYTLSGPAATQPAATVEEGPAMPAPVNLRQRRTESLQKLFAALTRHASDHGQAYPTAAEFERDWSSRFPLPERPEARYVYVAPPAVPTETQLLVVEPFVYDDARMTLLASGEITEIPNGPLDPGKPSHSMEDCPADPGNP